MSPVRIWTEFCYVSHHTSSAACPVADGRTDPWLIDAGGPTDTRRYEDLVGKELSCVGRAPSPSALKRFELSRTVVGGDFAHYLGTCFCVDGLGNDVVDKYTNNNTGGPEDLKDYLFIDRHDINCDGEGVLVSFVLEREIRTGEDQIRYHYRCAQLMSGYVLSDTLVGQQTAPTDGATNAGYMNLDKHEIDCGGNNGVLTSVRLRSVGGTNIFFRYSCANVVKVEEPEEPEDQTLEIIGAVSGVVGILAFALGLVESRKRCMRNVMCPSNENKVDRRALS